MKRTNWVLLVIAISFILVLTWPAIAGAQSLPHLKPIPTHRISSHAPASVNAASPWQPLTNQAPSGNNGVQLMMQGTDGSILIQAYDGQTWMKLTPDQKGSFINGTWTTLAPEPTARLYFASEVLPDGRVFVAGGEYSGPGLAPYYINTGEIYDPQSNTWTPITPYPDQPRCPVVDYFAGSATSGSPKITGVYPYTSGLSDGEGISGTGIPSGATIVSVDSATQITLSAPATQTTPIDIFTSSSGYELLGCLGDDPSALLSSTKILVGDIITPNTYIYDVASNSWAPSGTKVYPDQSDEEGWTMSTGGTIINYDMIYSVNTNGSYAEKYDIKTGTWTGISPSDGTAKGTIPVLSSTTLGYELGPALRLQDGRIFQIGANQHNAFYDPAINTWAAAPDTIGTIGTPSPIPSPFGSDDAPGAILPNGHVIYAADSGPSGFSSTGNVTSGSAVITGIPSTALLQPYLNVSGNGIPSQPQSYIVSVDSDTQVTINAPITVTATGETINWAGLFSPPLELFEFDPSANTITQVTSALPDSNLPTEPCYPARMLILPTGELLFSDSTAQLWVYTATGTPNPQLRPIITSIKHHGDGKFTLSGFKLNGQSAGASYGDDDQMNSNYPIIRMVNSKGDVFYAQTSDWSKFGVGYDGTETVDFTLNPAVTPGDYYLIVSGAGISSFPTFIQINGKEVGSGKD